MTDPVDTNALRDLAVTIEEVFRGEPYDASPEAIDEPALIRAAADEVDRLRAELDAWEPAWRNMRDERDRLRAIVDTLNTTYDVDRMLQAIRKADVL